MNVHSNSADPAADPAPFGASDSVSTLGLLFTQIRDALRARLKAELALAGHDLTFSQYVTLKKLARGIANAGELARAADLNPGAMTRLLDALAERGLIKRVADPDDRRALQIHLTDAGLATWRDISTCGKRILERALHGMDEDERATLVRLLEHARDNLVAGDDA